MGMRMEDRKLNTSVGFLAWAAGWVVSSINHKPVMATPNAFLLGALESWLAKGVMTSAVLRLRPSRPWTEPLCSRLSSDTLKE